jgi:hypothetical protein
MVVSPQGALQAETPAASPAAPKIGAASAPPSDATGADSRGAAAEELRFDRELLERQADRHVASIEALFNRATWALGGILSVAAALLLWLFGSSRKELQRSLAQTMREKAEEVVESEGKALRRRYQGLQDQVEAFLDYRNRPITWIARDEDTASPDVLDRLHAAGLQNINLVTPEVNRPFEVGTPDLLIISYDGSNEAFRRLEIAVRAGSDLSPPFPLLIYTFNHGGPELRLGEREMALLGEYRWYLPVNFPVQLVSQVSSFLRPIGAARLN